MADSRISPRKNTSELEQRHWEACVDLIVVSPQQKGFYFVMGRTPDVLLNLGLENLDMTMRIVDVAKVLGLVRDGHSITPDQLKKLPALIASPQLIFRSDSAATAPGLVVITCEFEKGNPVNAIIHPHKIEGHRRVNRVASVYGRNRWEKVFQEWKAKGLQIYPKIEKDWPHTDEL